MKGGEIRYECRDGRRIAVTRRANESEGESRNKQQKSIRKRHKFWK